MDNARATRFEIAGVLSFGLQDPDAATQRLVSSELDPFPALPASGEAEVVLERAPPSWRPVLVDIQGLAADGAVSASDGRFVYAVLGGRIATIPHAWRDPELRFVYQAGFPVVRVFSSLVRPSLQVRMLHRQIATVHAASVEQDGSAILVAGWSESGKTETALALMEGDARFLSDKWTVLSVDGRAGAFPISVGVRRWVLAYLPTLRKAVSRRSSAQFLVAGAARTVLSPVLRARGRGRVDVLVRRATQEALALADRVALSPTELRAAYDQHDDATRRIPIRMLVLLTTVPAGTRPTIRRAPPDWVIERLVRAAAFERRAFFAWQERAAYAVPSLSTDAGMWLDLERRVLEKALKSAELVHIEAPFPTDPRPIADLVRERLR